MDSPSIFQLEATLGKRKEEKFVHIFKLRADWLISLSDEYPEWKKFLLMRATHRRAFFMQT